MEDELGGEQAARQASEEELGPQEGAEGARSAGAVPRTFPESPNCASTAARSSDQKI